jgi:hypothetical protein
LAQRGSKTLLFYYACSSEATNAEVSVRFRSEQDGHHFKGTEGVGSERAESELPVARPPRLHFGWNFFDASAF